MNRIESLIESYRSFIAIPWREGIAPAQRVIFCIYNKEDERKIRARIAEFEIATRHAHHEWILFDITDSFAEWLAAQYYAEKYFEKPELIHVLLHRYKDYIAETLQRIIEQHKAGPNHVVALIGTGELFGFSKVNEIIDVLSPIVKGRLVVFFPGSYEHNNYRFFDAYDGWNYLAVPIISNYE
ncbi:MAG TPA: DUF1788 domain-containing protein [Rectinema sp.]|jgi:hypothetical protein|nr:DUF1788 domain-containing protein [Rectinema sp.]